MELRIDWHNGKTGVPCTAKRDKVIRIIGHENRNALPWRKAAGVRKITRDRGAIARKLPISSLHSAPDSNGRMFGRRFGGACDPSGNVHVD
jgi:hypothetical protein